jgi:predicted dehydrogenase
VQVVAICDVDRNIRNSRLDAANKKYADRTKSGTFKGAVGYNDFREVMARDDIDAVVVATPDHWHAPISIAAMRSGKDVYCEKPMTLTIAEGRAMSDVSRQYGRILQCGSQRRSGGKQRRACELVRNGRIGKLQRVEVGVGYRPSRAAPHKPEPVPEELDYEMWLGPAPWEPYQANRCHYQFRFVRDYSGGEMTNFGAHYLDVAQWGIGADDSGPVEIEGTGMAFEGLHNTFAKVDLTYTYADGVKLRCTHRGGGCRFYGTDGWIDAERLSGEPKSMLSSPIGPGDIRLYESRGGHMGNFLECVRTRQLNAAPGEVGHRSATVCHLGNIAMTLGRKLKWDPKAEEFIGDESANRMRYRPYREPWRP